MNEANVGIVCGEVAGFFVVDIDAKDQGLEYWKKYIDTHGDPQTRVVITGSGGRHYYFKYDERFSSNRTKCITEEGKKIGIDIKSNHGQVVAPGSIHECGKKYELINDVSINELGVIPEWLVEKIIPKESVCIKPSKPIKEPTNNSTLSHNSDVSFDALRDLVMNGLGDERAYNYEDWLKTIWIIHSCGSSDEYHSLAHEFSRRCESKYDEGAVDKVWSEYKPNTENKLTIGTLRHWCKEDMGEEDYFELIKKHECLVGKQGLLPIFDSNSKVYYGDYNSYRQGYTREDIFTKYIQPTIAIVSNGGNPLFVTKNLINQSISYLPNLFKHSSFKSIRFFPTDVDVGVEDKSAKSKDKGVCLGELIQSNQHRMTYSFLAFEPRFNLNTWKNEQRVFNEFVGFKAQQQQSVSTSTVSIEPILYHIKNVLCNGDDQCYTYFMNWLSHLIHKPEVKPEVAVVIRSIEGAGKSKFWDFIGEQLIGKAYYYKGDMNMICSKFNSLNKNKLLTVFEEVRSGGGNQYHEQLKTMISDKTTTIEQKGIDAYEVSSYSRYVILTNEDCPVKVTTSDRRYFCIEASGRHAKDQEYWNQLIPLLQNQVCGKLLYDHLLTNYSDLSKWNHRDIPETKARNEMVFSNIKSNIRFMIYLVTEADGNEVWDKEGNCKIHSQDLYTKYTVWCSQSGERNPIALKKFSFTDINLKSEYIQINGVRKQGYKMNRQHIIEQIKSSANLNIEIQE